MPGVFVVPCGGVIGATRPMSVVSRLTFKDRRAIGVRVVRVHVWMCRQSGVRIGGSAIFVKCRNSVVRRWVDVIVVPELPRAVSMRGMIS